MKINLQKFKEKAYICIKAFHMEAILGIICFVLFNIMFHNNEEGTHHLASVLLLSPSVLVLTYACNCLFHGKSKIIYYISALSIIILIQYKNLDDSLLIKNYPYTLLITVLLLLVCRLRWNNAAFVRHTLECVSDLAASFLVGLILSLAYSAIISSFFYIFSLQEWLNYRYYSYFCSFCGFVVTPMVFFYLQAREDYPWQFSKFMEGMMNFIITPAILIYTAILYLYFFTITVQWELPRGGVAYLVMAFILAAMIGQMTQYVTLRQYYNWFYNRLSFISIPPLIIFWIGCMERIHSYGFTESRVYLLAAGSLMTIYALFFFWKKRNYQIIAMLSICTLTILTYVPEINVRSIALRSQTRCLENYIDRLGLRDSTTGLLKKEFISVQTDSVNTVLYGNMVSSFRYIEAIQGEQFMKQHYGYTHHTLPEIKKEYANKSSLHFSINNKTIEAINTKEYPYFYLLDTQQRNETFSITCADQKTIIVTRVKDGKEILRYPLAQSIEKHPEWIEYTRTQEQHLIPLELFVVHSDECILVIRSFTYEKGKIRFVNYEAIFTK